MPAPGSALPSAYCIQPTTLPSARSIQPTTLLSAYSVQPAACYACSLRPGAQAPSDSIPPYASHPPFATHRASLHAWFLTQLHAMRPSSAQFSAQCPKRLLPRPQCPRRSQHPAHHASRRLRHPTHLPQSPTASGPPHPRRSQHPAHHTSRCLRHPTHHTQAPTALGSAPQAPTASGHRAPRRLQHPAHCTPDTRNLPRNASLGSLAWIPLAYHASSPDTPTTCSASDTHAKRP